MHRVPGQFPRKWRSRVWLNIQLNVIPHRVPRQYSMYGKRGGRGLIFKWTLYRTVFHVSSPCKGKEMGVVKYSKECQQCHWPQFHAHYSKNVVLPSILKSEVHTRLRGWGVTGQGGGGRRGGGGGVCRRILWIFILHIVPDCSAQRFSSYNGKEEGVVKGLVMHWNVTLHTITPSCCTICFKNCYRTAELFT